jgi:excisionase family DNA binding protein
VNQLLKPKELADLLGVPVSFVYDRTRRNSSDPIPHFKLGKYVRFDLATVQDWLAERSR